MNIRWLVAAAAAIGVGVLVGPMMFGDRAGTQEPGQVASHESGAACSAKKANLDFTLKDMHGATVKLADFKGKPILLNYWATWCGPCKAEIPVLNDLYAQYKDQGSRDRRHLRRRRRADAARVLEEVSDELHGRHGARTGRRARSGGARLGISDDVLHRTRWFDLRQAHGAGDQRGLRAGDQGAPVV